MSDVSSYLAFLIDNILLYALLFFADDQSISWLIVSARYCIVFSTAKCKEKQNKQL